MFSSLHRLHVSCHMSRTYVTYTCHVSHVAFHMSHVKYHSQTKRAWDQIFWDNFHLDQRINYLVIRELYPSSWIMNHESWSHDPWLGINNLTNQTYHNIPQENIFTEFDYLKTHQPLRVINPLLTIHRVEQVSITFAESWWSWKASLLFDFR